MNKKIGFHLLFVICFFLSASSVVAEVPRSMLKDIDNQWSCVKFNRSIGFRGLCMLQTKISSKKAVTGFLLTSNLEPLTIDREICGDCTLEEMKISRDGDQLAIITREEDRPVLSIFDMKPLIKNQKWHVSYSRSLYPGYLGIGCWKHGVPVLTSNQDLTRSWFRSEFNKNEGGLFLLDVESETVTKTDNSHCSNNFR